MSRKPEIGATAHCPADRGDLAYVGVITHVDPAVHTNINGVRFQWVTVRRANSTQSAVWPSHRLGFAINEEPAATPDIQAMRRRLVDARTLADLDALYVEWIGYSIVQDNPAATFDGVFVTLADYLKEMAPAD